MREQQRRAAPAAGETWQIDRALAALKNIAWMSNGEPTKEQLANIGKYASELHEVLAAIRTAPSPEQWTCFHCGETFTDRSTAHDHFGPNEDSEPACRIKLGAERSLVKALREAEQAAADAWFAIHNETTDAAKAYHTAACRHRQQLQAAEELGYERGLDDSRTAPSPDLERATIERCAQIAGQYPSDDAHFIAKRIRALTSPAEQEGE